MNFPEQLRYTKEHEWISVDGNVATIGITEFAQGELGDIIYVDIDSIGKEFSYWVIRILTEMAGW